MKTPAQIRAELHRLSPDILWADLPACPLGVATASTLGYGRPMAEEAADFAGWPLGLCDAMVNTFEDSSDLPYRDAFSTSVAAGLAWLDEVGP